MNERRGYGFSLEAKQYARDRANKHCLYGDGSCPRPNTNKVNHLTGCFEAFLKGADKRDISDPRQNAIMECSVHESVHDAQERLIVEQLKGERVIYERRTRRNYRRNKPRSQRSFHGKRR
jgi:hypothetical protein